MNSQLTRKEVVARAWFEGERSPVRIPNYRAESVRVGDDSVSALVSYGPHYVVAYPNPAGGYWVNATEFEGEDYRMARLAAGWSSGIKGESNGSLYGVNARTVTKSPTTAAHVAACESVLRDAGYSPVPHRQQTGPNGHTYQLWTIPGL